MPLWPKITGNNLLTGNYFLQKTRPGTLQTGRRVCYTYKIGKYNNGEEGPWGSFCRKTAHWPAGCAGPPQAEPCPMPSSSPAAETAWPPPALPPPPWSARRKAESPACNAASAARCWRTSTPMSRRCRTPTTGSCRWTCCEACGRTHTSAPTTGPPRCTSSRTATL